MTLASRLITSILLIAMAMQPAMACWMNAYTLHPAVHQTTSEVNGDNVASSTADKFEGDRPAAPHSARMEADSPPCHNTTGTSRPAAVSSPDQKSEQIPCAQCGDCDTAAIPVQSTSDKPLQKSPSHDVTIVATPEVSLHLERPWRVSILGPPRMSTWIEHTTLIILKQRLSV